MNITVILCTYNRWQSLEKALDSAARLQVPPSVSWEILVVDNNSKDQTRSVIESFCEKYPGHFRYLFEARPGKSHALNAGLRATQADIVAFMDDDVVVDPDWLLELTVCLQRGHCAGSGGRILPDWTGPRPNWLPLADRYGLAPLAMFDLGTEPAQLDESPFGTNMAFKREVFEKYGVFRTDLGPRPDSEIRNEDTEFGQRVLAAGETLWYVPSAVVHHAVPESRLRQEYFLKWWFDKSRADIREFGIPAGTRAFVAGVPLYLFRRLAVWTLRWLITLNPSRRFSNKIKVWGRMGEISECYHRSHGSAESTEERRG
jgi:glycosyltransferase involved in cell wall biosynthesis